MARWIRSVVSLITVVTVAGTPAVVSACLALCVLSVPAHHAADHSAGPAVHTQQAAPAVEPSATPCAEHGASGPTANARLSAAGHGCCADGITAPVTSVTAGRADAPLLGATTVASRASRVHVVAPGAVVLAPRPAAAPPSPPRRLAVLRV